MAGDCAIDLLADFDPDEAAFTPREPHVVTQRGQPITDRSGLLVERAEADAKSRVCRRSALGRLKEGPPRRALRDGPIDGELGQGARGRPDHVGVGGQVECHVAAPHRLAPQTSPAPEASPLLHQGPVIRPADHLETVIT
jgi:hypothetical protein